MAEEGLAVLSVVLIDRLRALPDQSIKCCIYKVDHLRQLNEEAYTPQVISIGPFHRNNPNLQKMEDFKLTYLKNFEERAETKLNDIMRTIKGEEERVRDCYSETIPLESDKFVEMILLDASFIIVYFWKNMIQNWTNNDKQIGLGNEMHRHPMQMDLMLLENQLPFFIIEKIYDTAFPTLSKIHPFIELTFLQFEDYIQQGYKPGDFSILHFTDLLRSFCLPPRKRRLKRSSAPIKDQMHSATELAKVGLKFKMRKSTNCSPIELKYANGVLEIPRFQLDKNTQIYARNLIAFEQCHFPSTAYITDYYFLLRLLIKSQSDVDLLVREKIIVDWVDGIDVTVVLDKILETINCPSMNDNYVRLAEKLNELINGGYLKITLAILKRDYFHNPWKGAATTGGVLLLLLTAIQAVCALISVKKGY